MARMSAGRALMESLRAEDVEYVFGIVGSCMVEFMDEFFDRKDIEWIGTRHEQGASHMADGYARVSGKTGVCMATNGPGATNFATGVSVAKLCHAPMIAMTGAVDAVASPSRIVPGDRPGRDVQAAHQVDRASAARRAHTGADAPCVPRRHQRQERPGAHRSAARSVQRAGRRRAAAAIAIPRGARRCRAQRIDRRCGRRAAEGASAPRSSPASACTTAARSAKCWSSPKCCRRPS